MVQVGPSLENPGWNKRVESSGIPCLDEGSIPSSSTTVDPTVFHPLEGSYLTCLTAIAATKYTCLALAEH